jgi:hypothetical protein
MMMITKREAAIISLYTGILIGDFGDMHEYAEELFGGGIMTHEFAEEGFVNHLKVLARPDFLKLCMSVEGFEMTDGILQILEDEGITIEEGDIDG